MVVCPPEMWYYHRMKEFLTCFTPLRVSVQFVAHALRVGAETTIRLPSENMMQYRVSEQWGHADYDVFSLGHGYTGYAALTYI